MQLITHYHKKSCDKIKEEMEQFSQATSVVLAWQACKSIQAASTTTVAEEIARHYHGDQAGGVYDSSPVIPKGAWKQNER